MVWRGTRASKGSSCALSCRGRLFRTTCGSRALYAALHETVSPRAFSFGLLADDRLWARMSQDRNLSVHNYNEELAEQVYGRLPDYLPALRHLSDGIDADRTPSRGDEL